MRNACGFVPRVLAVAALLVAAGGPHGASSAAVVIQVDHEPVPVITDGVLIVDGLDADPTARPPEVPSTLKRGATQTSMDGRPVDPDASPPVVVCFGASTPPEVQAIAKRSIETWTSELDLDGPTIEIDLYWIAFGSPQSLGAAGPGSFVQDPRLPDPAVRYPVALANQFLGVDFSPRDPCDLSSDPDMLVLLNRTAGGDGSMWNLSNDEPSEAQIDLESVILHELGHGWGVIGSADEDVDGLRWPVDGGAPFAYDRTVAVCDQETTDGCPSLTNLTVGDIAPLTSGNLWFDLGAGSSVELYAPEQWNRGSSFSHLDEDRYRDEQQLLTPFLNLGETVRQIDNGALAVLQQLGYGLTRPPAAIRSVDVATGDGSISIVATVADLIDAPPPAALEVQVLAPEQESVVHRLDPIRPVISGLVNGTAYRVRVRPVGAGGIGVWVSAAGPVTPQALPPFNEVADFVTVASRVSGVDLLIDDALADALVARARLIGATPTLVELFDADPASDDQILLRLYRGVLGRQADVGGFRFWADQIENGLPHSVVAGFFAASIEFAPDGELDDGEFIDAIYARILKRPPDDAGRAFWQAQLEAGLDRGWIVLALTESTEHRVRVDQYVFFDAVGISFIGRFPSPRELSNWSALELAGGRDAIFDRAVALALDTTP